MESAFLLDVVVRKSSSILELLSSKDQPLLIWRNAFLVLDLSLDVLSAVGRLNLQSDGLASQGLDEDLHTSSQSENEMEGRLLLDVVVRKSPTVFQLLSSEDQPLLVWRNAFLVLDLSLDVLDAIRWFDLESDGLASQGLDEDLHTSSQSENEMEGRLLLDVVVRKSSSILELFSSEDQPLLIWGDSLLVLDLSLDVLNAVGRLNLQSDGLASQGLDEDLHTSPQSENEMEGRLLLDVAVGEGSPVLQMLSSEDQPLLVWGDSLLVLDLSLDVLDAIRWFDLESDGLASQGLDEDLHTSSQ